MKNYFNIITYGYTARKDLDFSNVNFIIKGSNFSLPNGKTIVIDHNEPMPKEWLLNQANMRWGLTKKNKVGPVSELIRKCSPKSLGEWEEYYFKDVHSKQHLEELGRRLYIKITEVCHAEIESITEEDCINFIVNLVINRTYDGYQSEIQTVYGQLEQDEDGANIVVMNDRDREVGRIIVDNIDDLADFYIKKLNLFDKF